MEKRCEQSVVGKCCDGVVKCCRDRCCGEVL